MSGPDHAYRDAGESEVPLILLQHFRGNLDNWDPALADDLATARRGLVQWHLRRPEAGDVAPDDFKSGIAVARRP
jgi:hypothetical protein